MKITRFIFSTYTKYLIRKFNIPRSSINCNSSLISHLKSSTNNKNLINYIPVSHQEIYLKEVIIDYINYRNRSFFYIPYYNPVSSLIKLYGNENFLIKNSKTVILDEEIEEIYSSFNQNDLYFIYQYLYGSMLYNKFLVDKNFKCNEESNFSFDYVISNYVSNKQKVLIHLVVNSMKSIRKSEVLFENDDNKEEKNKIERADEFRMIAYMIMSE